MVRGVLARKLDISTFVIFSLPTKSKERLSQLIIVPWMTLTGGFVSKPLQGAKFCKFRNELGVENMSHESGKNLLQERRMHQKLKQLSFCANLSFVNQCSHWSHQMWQQECVGTWAFCSLPAVHAMAPQSTSQLCVVCPSVLKWFLSSTLSLKSISRTSTKDLNVSLFSRTLMPKLNQGNVKWMQTRHKLHC